MLDASFFKNIRRECEALPGPMGERGVQFISFSDGRPHDREYIPLMAAMQPLYTRFVKLYGHPDDKAVGHTIDLMAIRRGEQQRPGANLWHFDGTSGIQATDALPTEFLVNKPGVRLTKEQQAGRKILLAAMREGTLHYYSDEFIDELGFAIHTPKPREVVAFTTHMHRSPTNNTSGTVKRTWLRISQR